MNNNPTNNTNNFRFSNIDLDNNSNFKNFMLLTGVFSFLLSGLFFLINRLTILFLFLFSLTTIFTDTILLESNITGISFLIIISSFFIYLFLDVIAYTISAIFDKDNQMNIRDTE
jgi:hypothetical protein